MCRTADRALPGAVTARLTRALAIGSPVASEMTRPVMLDWARARNAKTMTIAPIVTTRFISIQTVIIVDRP